MSIRYFGGETVFFYLDNHVVYEGSVLKEEFNGPVLVEYEFDGKDELVYLPTYSLFSEANRALCDYCRQYLPEVWWKVGGKVKKGWVYSVYDDSYGIYDQVFVWSKLGTRYEPKYFRELYFSEDVCRENFTFYDS